MEKPEISKYPELNQFLNKKDHYILDENKNAIPVDLFTWGEWLEEDQGRRIVNRTDIDGKRVSTVFIGLDHRWSVPEERQKSDYKPHIFETMVFEGDAAELGYCERYSTWNEALEGHERAIQWVKNGCHDLDKENENES